jgi:hypothetical protein
MGLFLTGVVVLLRDSSGTYGGTRGGWEAPASVIFGNLCLVAAASSVRSRFALSPAGLTEVTGLTNAYIRLRWSEVEAVTLGVFDPPRSLPHLLLRVWSSSGHTFRRAFPVDSDFPPLARAMAVLRMVVEPELWARTKDALARGETLDLGRIKLSQSELTISGQLGALTAQTFPISTLQSVAIDRDRTLVVEGESNGSASEARCPLVEVKNVFVLARLLTERVPGARKKLRFSWE